MVATIATAPNTTGRIRGIDMLTFRTGGEGVYAVRSPDGLMANLVQESGGLDLRKEFKMLEALQKEQTASASRNRKFLQEKEARKVVIKEKSNNRRFPPTRRPRIPGESSQRTGKRWWTGCKDPACCPRPFIEEKKRRGDRKRKYREAKGIWSRKGR